ncbi:MAG: MBL fold metallo-hydrolase [Deltaproteobacteria bacterium]|nr:MBL fold metallo-hydrolase [Deltaproteobacteria bacterium]MBW2360220.1 MBL fold metallo-hydrolase [Deltaproteobacteria bacterium]
MSVPLYRSRPGEPFHAKLGSQQINEFIHLSEGFSNAFLIVTSEGRIVVNAGMGMEAPIHKRNFDAISTAPTRYIILTQGHVDHVGGVPCFLEEGTEVVAHAGNAEHQSYDARLAPFRGARSAFAFKNRIKNLHDYVVKELGPPPPQAIPTPTITFEDHHEIELGGLRIELLGVAGGETNDSLVIWLPDHGICFTGNLFGCLFGHFPNLVTIRGDRYRDALTVAAAVDRVLELEPEHLLVGHHQPIAGKALIREELERLRGAIHYVHDETVKGMNEGKDVHTLMQEIQLPPELEVGEGYGKVSWSVRAIWESYAGWFHHRSTTELYSVPPRAIHGDLVELVGGQSALVERARARFEAGEAIEALHLLDVVLTQPRVEPAALDLAIAVHRKLENESVNFWLTPWLQTQVEKLEQRRDAQ